MRNAFINELVALAERHPQIALIVGDLGYSVVEPFVDRFPERFINAGVAEQNMTGLAAGMASEGYHVFTYSIANFPTFRCAEQIRNDVDYQKLPVTVVAVGGGLAYGALGYSHHAVQDYALMRAMPNMLIAAPGDPSEVRGCLRYLVENPQPSYLRLSKAGERDFHSGKIPNLQPGLWNCVSSAESDLTQVLLTTGATLELAMAKRERGEYSGAGVSTLPLWGMSVKKIQSEQVARHDKVITIEDHLEDGGFGSWIAEAISRDLELRNRLHSIALSDKVCGLVGSQMSLNNLGGLL